MKAKSSHGTELNDVEERDELFLNQDTSVDHTSSMINDLTQRDEESVLFEDFGDESEVCLYRSLSGRFFWIYMNGKVDDGGIQTDR